MLRYPFCIFLLQQPSFLRLFVMWSRVISHLSPAFFFYENLNDMPEFSTLILGYYIEQRGKKPKEFIGILVLHFCVSCKVLFCFVLLFRNELCQPLPCFQFLFTFWHIWSFTTTSLRIMQKEKTESDGFN